MAPRKKSKDSKAGGTKGRGKDSKMAAGRKNVKGKTAGKVSGKMKGTSGSGRVVKRVEKKAGKGKKVPVKRPTRKPKEAVKASSSTSKGSATGKGAKKVAVKSKGAAKLRSTGTKSKKPAATKKKPSQAKRKRKSEVVSEGSPKRRKKSEPVQEFVVFDDTPLSPMDKLSLEVLCKIISFLPLKDALKLQCQSRTLLKAVSLHLRICKTLNFTEGEVCGQMSALMSDRTFGYLVHRCPDLTNIYGFHPQRFCKPHCPKHQRLNDCLTVKGLVLILKNCQKLVGIETSNIHMLEAVLHKLPHIKIIGLFKNRNGGFPAQPGTSFCLRQNPPITKLHLTGVILPDLPRMDSLIYLSLKWVKFTNVNPFREFMAPRLHTFVMNNCSGPTNALKYVPLVTRLAAASNLTRLELVRVPFLGAFFQHVVEDTWRLGGFRQLKKILISACKHATEIDMGHLLLTAAESIGEVYIQPSLTKDSLFLALSMAEPDFPKIDTVSLGYVDPFPVEKGKWEPIQLTLAGLADAGSSENAALITDVGIQHVGKDFTFVKNLTAYNCPHLINPRDWLSPDGMCFAQLRSLHLNRCHAIKLQPFCDMLTELPSIETVYIERMFREPPKGCSRVGLSAGTGLGVSSAFVANQEPAAPVPAAAAQAPADGPANDNQAEEDAQPEEPPGGNAEQMEGENREDDGENGATEKGEGSAGQELGEGEAVSSSGQDDENSEESTLSGDEKIDGTPGAKSELGNEVKENEGKCSTEGKEKRIKTEARSESLSDPAEHAEKVGSVEAEGPEGEVGMECSVGESQGVGEKDFQVQCVAKSTRIGKSSNLEKNVSNCDGSVASSKGAKSYSGKGKRPVGKNYFKKRARRGDAEGGAEDCKGGEGRKEGGKDVGTCSEDQKEVGNGSDDCKEVGVEGNVESQVGKEECKDGGKSDDRKECEVVEDSKEGEAVKEEIEVVGNVDDGPPGKNIDSGKSNSKQSNTLSNPKSPNIEKSAESVGLDNQNVCADISGVAGSSDAENVGHDVKSEKTENCPSGTSEKMDTETGESSSCEMEPENQTSGSSKSGPQSPPPEMRKTVATQTSYEDASDLDQGPGPSGEDEPGPQAHSTPQESPRKKKRDISVFQCLSQAEEEDFEEDYPQVLTIRSRTLVSLTIHMVGVTHLFITDSPQMKVIHGTACRVLKEVRLQNTPKLTRVTFAQCTKLNHMSIVKDITKLPPTNDRFVFLRPMMKFDPLLIEKELFRADNGYHGCLIQDHSLDPGATQIQKARFIEKLKLVSSISFHILRLNKYPTFKKTVSDEHPWGRNLHNLSGKTPDNSPWEAVTDIPWLPHLENLCTKEENKDAVDIIEEKLGLHKLYSMDHIWPFGCFEGLATAIGHAQAAESAIQPRTIGIYINTCDVSSIPTPDVYV